MPRTKVTLRKVNPPTFPISNPQIEKTHSSPPSSAKVKTPKFVFPAPHHGPPSFSSSLRFLLKKWCEMHRILSGSISSCPLEPEVFSSLGSFSPGEMKFILQQVENSIDSAAHHALLIFRVDPQSSPCHCLIPPHSLSPYCHAFLDFLHDLSQSGAVTDTLRVPFESSALHIWRQAILWQGIGDLDQQRLSGSSRLQQQHGRLCVSFFEHTFRYLKIFLKDLYDPGQVPSGHQFSEKGCRGFCLPRQDQGLASKLEVPLPIIHTLYHISVFES